MVCAQLPEGDVLLDIPGLKPTMSMEVLYKLKGEGGEPIDGVIHNTIHAIGDAKP